ncbi:hypothetical protein RRG08_002988 [Elysia crispata]|uniref:Uncharacterized protein n=1 Tax=Elysia crispata TaxID=231223 RepID=A0AAE1B2K6_9GAST|nr:hypothetical protein RRG08_002988 [Elysia crispata]
MSEHRQKWTAFIAEIEKTTHHVREPTKVNSFHRGHRRKQHTISEHRQKWTAFIAEMEKTHNMSENRQKWTAFIAEIKKTTHHVKKPTMVDSFHRGDRENNTPCQRTDKSEQLSSRR